MCDEVDAESPLILFGLLEHALEIDQWLALPFILLIEH